MEAHHEIITFESHQHAHCYVVHAQDGSYQYLPEERIPAHWHRSIEMTYIEHRR